MKILLIAPLTSETGNFSTADRILRCLSDSNNDCWLRCITSFKDDSSLKEFVYTHDLECAIGIHAWRAGRLLLDCPVPFAIIFGGTDLNENHRDKEKLETMNKVTEKARYLVAFSDAMKKQALVLWPKCEEKIILQPQAVCVGPSGFKFHDYLKQITDPQTLCHIASKDTHGPESFGLIVFLLVAGLRPVKDPLYLAASITEWHKKDRCIHLIIVGPELDTEFAREVKSEVERLPGVVVLPPLPACDLHAAIQNCFAVVNSSTSEGMASAVLESMVLGVPVLARNIPGNSFVKHRESGLLFNTPEEFVTLAKELKESPSLHNHITTNATKYVSEHHSVEAERKTYKWLVKKLVSLW
ncbi:Glycosyl transferases group 1 [Desmophyllum pertusum]|uniref:Glycosyl transferases group 1 n=1 Tax=Desmophyllum pertusum TaxID=174260 RepID=A0A9W9YD04_9CNID|nr:Glycosyl transferases group 1 [Desmophyllum pertusum]